MDNSLITEITADGGCEFNRIIVHSFGSVLVFIFYSEADEQSRAFLENINNSIPIFGEYDNVKYYKLSVEKCPQTCKKFEVEKTPSVVFTQNDKKIIDRYDGSDIGAIFDKIERLSQEHKAQFEKDQVVWYPKVKSILESCPFIVFTKGTPENPKCGFTRKLLQILKTYDIEYAYFDIQGSKELTNWVRHYSKWMTYPQVFINGKLIGGLDSTKELIEKGEFEKLIPESCKKGSPKDRFERFIAEHETIVFVNGFAFENKDSEIAIESARKKYGDNVTIYNTAIEKNLQQYLAENVCKEPSFVVHNKEVVKN